MHLISTRWAAYLSGLERYVITQITHRPATPLFSTNLTLFLVVFMQYAQEFTLMYTASLWRSISQFSSPQKLALWIMRHLFLDLSTAAHLPPFCYYADMCSIMCVCRQRREFPSKIFLSLSVFGSCHRQAFGNKKGKVKKRGSGKSADTEVS